MVSTTDCIALGAHTTQISHKNEPLRLILIVKGQISAIIITTHQIHCMVRSDWAATGQELINI
jgi:hypothetical protein